MPIIDSYPLITSLVGDERILCTSVNTTDDANNITPFSISNYLLSIGGFIVGAQNIGASGVGVFKQESSGNLQLLKIDANSNKISVSIISDVIEIDVNQANLDLSAIGGAISLVSQTSGLLPLTSKVSGILPVLNGGTGSSTYNLSSVPGSISLVSQVSGVLPTLNGGAGQSTYTNGQLLIGNAAGSLTKANITPGNGVQIVNGNGAITVSSLVMNDYIYGLILSFGSVDTAVIGSGNCMDSINSFQIVSSSNITVNITASGVNGLDTGSRSANNWYSVFIIADSTGINSPKGLFSLSSTSPTLPSGYNKFRRVGWVRNNASNVLLRFLQNGLNSRRQYIYDDLISNFLCLTNGNSTVFSAINLSGFMPSTAVIGIFILLFTVTGGGTSPTDRVTFRPTGSAVAIANCVQRYGNNNSATNPQLTQITLATNNSQSLDYAVTVTGDSVSLNIISFEDNL